MGFMYHGISSEKLTDKEMVTDVRLTHMKMTDDIRKMLTESGFFEMCKTESLLDPSVEKYIGQYKDLEPKQIGQILYHASIYNISVETAELMSYAFNQALMYKFSSCDRTVIEISSEYSNACHTFENFAHTHLAGVEFDEMIDDDTHLRLKDKYRQYSNSAEQCYDFFMLPTEKKLKLLVNNKA